ncbi:MAG: ATP-binding cassette domain-containing protein, partial [Planctomycetota bacterium]
GERVTHRPNELSGGEQKRVAIARALFYDPPLLLADEPTGELDSATGGIVLDLLRETVRDDARALVIVTHDASLLRPGDRVVRLKDGRIVVDEVVQAAEST